MIQEGYCKEKLDAGNSSQSRVKCISIRAMTYDRSNICNAWWKKGKKQNKETEKQNLAGYFYKKPDASPEQYLMF